MSRLILLGTIHRDPQGEEVLLRTIGELRPELITVEVSPYALRFRKRHAPRLLRENLPLQVAEFILPPYEYRAAKAYGLRCRVPVIPVDSCLKSRVLLRRAVELFSAENLRRLKEEDLKGLLRREYALARRCWQDGFMAQWFLSNGWDLRRERAMARRIRQILSRHPTKRLLHVGGWMHMLPLPGTLFHLLEDLGPERRLLEPLTFDENLSNKRLRAMVVRDFYFWFYFRRAHPGP